MRRARTGTTRVTSCPLPNSFRCRSFVRALAAPAQSAVRGLHARRDDQPPLPAAGLKLGDHHLLRGCLRQLAAAPCSARPMRSSTSRTMPGSAIRPPATSISRSPACARSRRGATWCGPRTTASRRSIGPHGEVIARAPEFKPYVLRGGDRRARSGLPPYAVVGNWPVLLLALAGVAASIFAALRHRRT